MGIVALRDIEVSGYIGVREEERLVGRTFHVDIEVHTSLKKAGQSDSVADVLNYAVLAEIVHSQMGRKFHLLEAAARAIAEAVLEKFSGIQTMKISIKKLHPFLPGNIGAAVVVWDYPEDY